MLLRGSARRLVRWLDGSRRPAAARQPALRGWSGPAPRGAAGRERRLAAALDAAGHGERDRARDQVTLDPRDSRHCQLLQQVHIGDIAGACRARLSLDPG
jgi:hypothetical protein